MTYAPYITPTSSDGFPGALTLNQFLQTVFVGLSELPGTLVRPSWQVNPPKQPDIDVNWMAFGVAEAAPDSNAYVTIDTDDVVTLKRNRSIQVDCSFYGPLAFQVAELVADGFQIQQNLFALRDAKMGFTATTPAIQVPDLVNERWVARVQMSVILQRTTVRVYPISTFVSANGTIHTVLGSEEYLIDWQTR